MGVLKLPPGKRIAVTFSTDVCSQCLWMGGINMPTPASMARGEFGARVGTKRLLDLYDDFGFSTTFFIPGHTLDTFPEVCQEIASRGHELGHHGYYHEDPRLLSRTSEEQVLQRGFEAYERVLGLRPIGYRAPALDFSEHTLDLLEQYGFVYDSSLMAHDLLPYHPQRWQVNWESGNVAGPASSVLELPASWFLDDFPTISHVPGRQEGLADTSVWVNTHIQAFDYAYNYLPASSYISAVHPQTAGQAHMMTAYRRLLEYIAGHDGVWFATLAEVAGCWRDDDDDLKLRDRPDVRGTADPPNDSGLTPYILSPAEVARNRARGSGTSDRTGPKS